MTTMEKNTYTQSHISIKRIFRIGFISLVIGAFLLFIGLFGYYLWIELLGDNSQKETIATQFSADFRKNPNIHYSDETIITPTDVENIIRSNTPVLGSPDAPVTIVMFIDFHCPFCKQAYPTIQALQEQYGPILRIVFKHFPVNALHPEATNTSMAAQCTQSFGKFWQYHDILFESEDKSEGTLSHYAKTVGIPLTQFQSCISTNQTQSHITEDLRDGIAFGIQGTPTYIVNGKKIEGAITLKQWDTVIIQSLKQ